MINDDEVNRRLDDLETKVERHVQEDANSRTTMMRWIIGLLITVSLSFLGMGWQFMTYLENKFTDLDAKIEKVDEKIFTLYKERK